MTSTTLAAPLPTHDSTLRYGSVSRLLHWGMAALFLYQFGAFFNRINEGEHWLGALVSPLHGSVGALIGLLVFARIAWAVRQSERPVMQGATAMLANAGHKALYLCMLLLPVTGVLNVVGNGYGWGFFGLQLVAASEVETAWMVSLGGWHSSLAWLTLILVLGHIAAALYHHFVLKDDTFARMAR